MSYACCMRGLVLGAQLVRAGAELCVCMANYLIIYVDIWILADQQRQVSDIVIVNTKTNDFNVLTSGHLLHTVNCLDSVKEYWTYYPRVRSWRFVTSRICNIWILIAKLAYPCRATSPIAEIKDATRLVGTRLARVS